MVQRARLATNLSGTAGEFFVAGELARRGYVASVVPRNAEGIDVFAARVDGSRTVAIQVKTSQGSGKVWMLSRKAEALEADGLFYVFVNLNGLGAPDYHVVPSAVVAEHCRRTHAEWLGSPGRGGHVRKDTSIRSFWDPTGEWRDR